ncbi:MULTISPECIES: phage tail assembly protein [unclassified Vibrio]|uniref:phage tail assembly protein n=1 Tax=unclassified Vibrio TaxID=2614977 RepID=UPI001361A045|nr:MULTISPECIES: phage tail assembly protein [unclassified Vibrio]NAW59495.1 phage tail assembly protein [Vibrio sp. V36_P2S2PM302]NAX25452.1 phage tail assembly protein [Vibrio sp. V38_P2S17PM301]NAX30366.1 phage tail assembly protein [Vibrio sp. V37_P2S8PM304]
MTSPIKNQSEVQTATLPKPIEKDGQTLATIDITKPHSGHLRGLSLIDVCEMNFDAGMKILPRVSCLNERDLANLAPENWAPLLTTIASFFVDTEH